MNITDMACVVTLRLSLASAILHEVCVRVFKKMQIPPYREMGGGLFTWLL